MNLGNLDNGSKSRVHNYFKKTSPNVRRGLRCEYFTTKNLSEWRENLLRDDSNKLVHVGKYREVEREVKNIINPDSYQTDQHKEKVGELIFPIEVAP